MKNTEITPQLVKDEFTVNYSNYSTKPIEEAILSQWEQVFLLEEIKQKNITWMTQSDIHYRMSIAYGRLAIMNKAVRQESVSNILFNKAIINMNLFLVLSDSSEKLTIDDALIEWQINSLDGNLEIAWKDQFDYDDSIRYPAITKEELQAEHKKRVYMPDKVTQ